MNKISYCVIILILIVIASNINVFKNEFISLDDYKNIIDNPAIKDLSARKIIDIFTPSRDLVSRKYLYYSPLHILSLAIDYKLHGLNPFWYHLTNILFHLLACIAAFFLVLLIAKRIGIAFWTSVFFALHPVHVEAVTWINARLYPMMALFIFLSLIFYIQKDKIKWARPISVIFYICAFLSHSLGIVLPALLFLYDINFEVRRKSDWREKLEGYIPYIVAGLLAYGAFASYGTAKCSFGPWNVMAAKIITRISFPLSMLILPFSLYYIGYNFQFLGGPILIEILKMCSLFILFVSIFAFISFRKNNRIVSFSILWAILYLVPCLSMSIFDRYLYLPSFGFCLVLAYYLDGMAGRWKAIALILCILIAAFYFDITVKKNTYWRDSYTLAKNLLRLPDNASHIMAGDFYNSCQNWKRAESEYLQAEAGINTKNPEICRKILLPIYKKMVDLYKKTGDVSQAERYSQKMNECGQ